MAEGGTECSVNQSPVGGRAGVLDRAAAVGVEDGDDGGRGRGE